MQGDIQTALMNHTDKGQSAMTTRVLGLETALTELSDKVLTVCCLMPAACCVLCAACRLLSALCSYLPDVYCLLAAVCCLLSAVCCLLSAACYPWFLNVPDPSEKVHRHTTLTCTQHLHAET
jgi:hypothetical protein